MIDERTIAAANQLIREGKIDLAAIHDEKKGRNQFFPIIHYLEEKEMDGVMTKQLTKAIGEITKGDKVIDIINEDSEFGRFVAILSQYHDKKMTEKMR